MKKIDKKVKAILTFINRDLKRVTLKSFKREYDKKVVYETR